MTAASPALPATGSETASVSLPTDWADFRSWLATDPSQPERRWPGAPILPEGPLHAPLMIVTDMPDPADMAAGKLLSEQAGSLFDAMLRAIGLARADLHIASLFLTRPPGGMVETADLAAAAERMRAHVAFAAPRRLLLLGDRTGSALAMSGSADGLRSFNHDGGTVPAVATIHPRLMLNRPAAKAECWRTLQCLIEERP
ncbi:MAG: uracil-DNA glycosylase family protein [Sphingobium sp.]